MQHSIKATARAAQKVVEAGSEHYHFAMACGEFGESAVLDKMRKNVQAEQECTFPEAAVVAATQFKLMVDLPAGNKQFKKIRDDLRMEAESKNAPTKLNALPA